MAAALPIFLATILAVVYMISHKYADRLEKYHEYILSISSGMLLAVIFVEVMPELIEVGTTFLSAQTIALSMLSGIVAYHLIEKYTYKHAKTDREITKDIGYLHVSGFLADNFLEGLVIVLIFGLTAVENFLAYILFVPLLLGDIAASINLRHINDRFRLGKVGITLLSSSVIMGTIVGLALNLQTANFYIALSVVTGMFIYFITRDELPRGRKGKPLAFLVGLISILLIFLLIRAAL